MSPDNVPLVLIPGFMLDEELWSEFIAAYPIEKRFIHVRLDQGATLKEMAVRTVQALPERFILIGFSLGGYVARAIYDAFPERTAAMIIVASSLRDDSPEQKKRRASAASSQVSGKFFGLSTAAIRKSLHTNLVNNTALIEKIRNMGKRLGTDVFRIQSGLSRERATLKPVMCPLYVIAARNDRLRSSAEAEELAGLTGTDVDYVEDCGHLIPLEKPDELAQRVYEWLAKTVN